MGMHPDKTPSRSTEDLSRIYAAWAEYAAARKRRADLLRIVAKKLNRVFQNAVSVKSSFGPTPLLDPELFFEPSVPMYPIMSYAWVPEDVKWISELEALGHFKPWRGWWMTRSSEHLYNKYFRPCNQGFPICA